MTPVRIPLTRSKSVKLQRSLKYEKWNRRRDPRESESVRGFLSEGVCRYITQRMDLLLVIIAD